MSCWSSFNSHRAATPIVAREPDMAGGVLLRIAFRGYFRTNGSAESLTRDACPRCYIHKLKRLIVPS